jgi:glycosyltransferase involved in cell wall biosynthesis
MRILLHDHAGHPFQAELARELARRGHRVHHVHCDTFASAKGALALRPDDPSSLTFGTISHNRPFSKYRWGVRLTQEVQYGRRATRLITGWKPDVVLSCNTPLLSQVLITRAAQRTGARSVLWVQDLYSDAAVDVLRSRLGTLGASLGRALAWIEARTLRGSDQVVAISENFVPRLCSWGVSSDRITVIPNWAPLDELPRRERPTAWERLHGLDSSGVVMYTGILGLKHDPSVLADIAGHLAGRAVVVVAASGPGMEWLEAEVARKNLGNVRLFEFQSNEVYADVLGTADVLVALLTDQSGRYSVPSKVLSYLCSGRPILAVMPLNNDAAATIERSGAGIVVPPGDRTRTLTAVELLMSDPLLRSRMGNDGRRYAEREFDITERADRFESLLRGVGGVRAFRGGRRHDLRVR